MHEYPRHIVTVAGVIRDDDGLVLLVRTKDKGWMFPGGQVEVGEDLMQALSREAKEESNCTALHFDGRVTYRVYTTRPYNVLREWKL